MKTLITALVFLSISQSGFAANEKMRCPEGSAENFKCELLNTESPAISQNYKNLLICSIDAAKGYIEIESNAGQIKVLPLEASTELGYGNFQFSENNKTVRLGVTASQPPFPGTLSFLNINSQIEMGSFSCNR